MQVTGSAGAESVVRPTPLVSLRSISKQFGATIALDDVSVAFAPGQVHALVGENGAGKSTLGKIVAGVQRPDRGKMLVDGEPVRFGSPYYALAAGIASIQQELSLVPRRTVLENVFLGNESGRAGARNVNAMRRRFSEVSEHCGFDVPGDVPTGELTVGEQQKVEIMRALARDARLIVMDEPTAALDDEETARLTETVHMLRAQGTAIVYVSHFLEEVLDLADTITVLRNGALVQTAPASACGFDQLVELMLGRPLGRAFPPRQPIDASLKPAISVSGLGRRGAIRQVSFAIRPGEILGLAGLVGSGRTEVARAVFGADPADEGAIEVDGRPVRVRSPRDAIRHGIAYVPESRKDEGLHLQLSVAENVAMAHLAQLSVGGVVSARRRTREASALIEHLDIRPPRPGAKVQSLSGGNQQKVLFAKWLVHRPRVLIVDDPTRGVDIGAKLAIYELIVELARQGVAVLVISSELEELLGLAHRVCVMRRGRLIAEFSGQDATYENVTRAALGSGLSHEAAA